MNIFWELAIAVIGVEFVGLLGSVFTFASIPTWYKNLHKPRLTPPNWLFGPVWTVLYLLMAMAAWQIWRMDFGQNQIKIALIIFVIQLVLNLMWSAVFFGLRNIGGGLLVLILLLAAIVWTITAFFAISLLAGYLLLPYFIWTCFAFYLNLQIWQLNK